MQSQGSTSSQPSFDSLSSSDSLLFSDSEQAEDDADVFLTDSSPPSSSSAAAIAATVLRREGGGAATDEAAGSDSPRSQWTCDGFTDKEEEEEAAAAAGGGSGKTAAHPSIPKTQGDLLFAQKCVELQGFVRPLLELLNGLKRGRFERGLSSFQQSMAMDRIQRIVGVLQRPNIGEKYLSTLLQLEMMLKLWFPHIAAHPPSAPPPQRRLRDTPSSTPPHKHQDQLHIPVKKRRLSWTGTESSSPSPVLQKCPRLAAEETSVKCCEDERGGLPSSSPLPPPSSPVSEASGEDASKTSATYKSGQSSEPSLTWVHVAPILSPRKPCPSHDVATVTAGGVEAIGRKGSPAMQDCSITSTTTRENAKTLKKPAAWCQSERETTTIGACPDDVTLKPLTAVGPAPIET